MNVCRILLLFVGILIAGNPIAHAQAPESNQDVAGETAPARNGELAQALAGLDAAWPEKPDAVAHRRATLLFKLGRYKESIADYDRAAKHGRPHDDISCWERGLAHYYAGNYREGADQFQRYHTVGPTDIENGLWYFLCIAGDEGIEKAREKMFPYPRMRPAPFPALLALYNGEGTADAVFEESNRGEVAENDRTEHLFFAHYYVAKYHEIEGEKELFQKHLGEALKYKFQHFMYACAEADAARSRD